MSRTLAILLILMLVPQAVRAQSVLPIPLSVEVRLGAGMPVGDFAEREPGIRAETGPMLGAALGVHLTGRLALMGGYSRTSFACPRCAEQGLDDQVVDQGGDLALELVPARVRGTELWVRAGAVYHQIAFSGPAGDLYSDPAVGLQAGGGVHLRLVRGLRLSPGVQFRTFPAELELGSLGDQSVDVSHVLVDVGLSYRF